MPVSIKQTPTNRLIAALPHRSRQKCLADCDRVEFDFAEVLIEPGAKIRYVYFPLNSFVSLITTLDDGHRLEVGMIGDEGVFGMALALGVNISGHQVVVQGAGAALRMSAAVFLKHCETDAPLREMVLRYAYVLMNQLARTAACTRYHVIEARLARWLLMTRDRAQSDRFQLTHKFLAYMLGVRRVGITAAASSLHKRGLIDYNRGNIFILDRPGLETASCGCYVQDKAVYEKILRLPRLVAPHS